MHEQTRNTPRLLNEVSSAQISSVVLVLLMILSVTRPPYRHLPIHVLHRARAHVCVSQPASATISILNGSLTPAEAMHRRFAAFPLFSVVLLYFDTHHNVEMRDTPRFQTVRPNRKRRSYASLRSAAFLQHPQHKVNAILRVCASCWLREAARSRRPVSRC